MPSAQQVQNFIGKYTNKHVEFNGNPVGSAGRNQCTDIVNQWLSEIGLKPILGKNAIDFKTAPGYRYVMNTPAYVPPVGSVAIFNIGKYGHVSIVAPGTNVRDLITFDQNYPLGSKCKVVNHRLYGGIAGFLEIKGSGGTNTYTVVAGDSLSKIAAKFGTSWQSLAKINNIKSPYVIHPGQVIRIS